MKEALFTLLLLSCISAAGYNGIAQGGLYNSEEQLDTYVSLLTL